MGMMTTTRARRVLVREGNPVIAGSLVRGLRWAALTKAAPDVVLLDLHLHVPGRPVRSRACPGPPFAPPHGERSCPTAAPKG